MSILRDCPNQPNSKTNPVIDEFAGSHGLARSTEIANVTAGSTESDPIAPDDANMSTNSLEDGARTPDGPASAQRTAAHRHTDHPTPDDGGGGGEGGGEGGESTTFAASTDTTTTQKQTRDLDDSLGALTLDESEEAGAEGGSGEDGEQGSSGTDEPTPPFQPRPDEVVFVLSVHDTNVGRIIGKGGQTIQDIQQRSGARVDIPQHCDPGTPRHIRIIGSPEQVEYCSVLVRLQLPNQTEAEIQHLQHEVAALQARHTGAPSALPALHIIEVPMQLVGRIIGRHGQYLRQLKEQTGATVTLPRLSAHGTPQANQIFTVMGSAEEVADCVAILSDKVNECASSTSTPSPQPSGRRSRDHAAARGAADGGGGAAASGGGGRQHQHQHAEVLIVDVPNEHVGRVIGKGGAAIRELQRQTGAKIHLPGENAHTKFREMQVHGTAEQRQRCYDLLIKKVPYLEQANKRTAQIILPTRSSGGYHGHRSGEWGLDGSQHHHGVQPHLANHPHAHMPYAMPHHQAVPYAQAMYDGMGYPHPSQQMSMYPHGMVYPGMQMMPPQMYQEQAYGHSISPVHGGYEVHNQVMSPQQQFEWGHVPPPMYPQAEGDGTGMMVPQASPPHGTMHVVMQSPPVQDAPPMTAEPSVEGGGPAQTQAQAPQQQQQQQPRSQHVAWGRPGPLPEGKSEWPQQ